MAQHKFTQGTSGRVTTADYMDELNIINELRQIVEDLATIIGQVKLGDNLYPANGSIGILATNVVKNNFNADAEPEATDDETEGYSKGSIWIYEVAAYICVEATEDDAVWARITPIAEP